ncbi:MAG TPA: DUF3618 domain-containing protein [Gemmatimonadaceae bacterium]|jgi:hypothetical protein|nr:DUF3618 domain-containing protein [Gemmatimonadaceae bacterium]
MAETTADVRRDIELTRNRISDTLEELEHKLNVTQIIKDNPWPSLALAVGAGVLLSGSRADVKAAAATVTATRGASGRIGNVLDELVSQVVQSFHGVIEQRIEGLANDVKRAIGAPVAQGANAGTNANSSLGYQQGAGDGPAAAPRAD